MDLLISLILNTQIKILHWLIKVFTVNGKTLNLHITATNLKFLLQLPDESYFVLDIQDCFEYIIKKHETIADSFPVQIYINKIKNRIVFKIKTRYKLELLSPKTMKLLASAKKLIDQGKDSEDVSKLESGEVALVHYNLVNNSYQQSSKVLFTFVPNKQFGQLITITPHLPTMLKSTNA